MPNYDTSILIQNIRTLMRDKGITQEKLADILGMSQSNVSKALSENDKKSFTLDQVVGIAKHFSVSVDMLVGNQRTAVISKSPRAIAAFLADIIASHDAKYTTVEIEEDVFEVTYDPYPSSQNEKRTISYPAIYLPSYWSLADYGGDDGEAYAEATQCGNDTQMQPVNDFLKQFKEIFTIYDHDGLSEDTYKTVVADLLSHLRE